MPRIQPIEIDQADAKTKGVLENVSKALGLTPNIMRTMANSPVVLQAYLGFGKTLGGGGLSASLREQIALTVSNENGCEYCTSAHAALGKKFGLDDEEVRRSLQATATDPKVEAALRFSKAVVVRRGWVTDAELQSIRAAQYSEGEITEIIATVAITIFTNYFNHVAETEPDFPKIALEQTANV